ncbi:sensor histidine kinase [Deinococcus sp. Marseille-Q6407]|uniref:sensor histidine kinase n=1 Tax=Deinococcus sp. Marseille-Q6407 TaxID=2969223 RepID=UPI0021C10869|nr:ATP-binding protein [Deinococcus sp. Marseille-Q6407]
MTGDRDTLHQAVVNLLSNALKYTRTREQARIEVWAEEGVYEWTVFVRDNGVGFDPRYSERLFGVFQRLHRADEFEGTGVGLANVRRIVTRHGGTVFAESQLGEGATFGFTLPKPN